MRTLFNSVQPGKNDEQNWKQLMKMIFSCGNRNLESSWTIEMNEIFNKGNEEKK